MSIARCKHGVYLPPNDQESGLAWGCQLCYPAGHPETEGAEAPVLPRSSGDTLCRRDDARETCSCGNLRTYFTANCRHCGAAFPEDSLRGREQGTANRRQAGSCPECGSTVHYETDKKSVWQCADCDTKFKAPKITEEAVNE